MAIETKTASMLLGLTIGDTFGSAYEFIKGGRQQIEKEFLWRYQDHHNKDFVTTPAGMYTDDTQMSIALAELLLSGQPFTPLTVAQSFLDTYHRHPINGYARQFQKFLNKTTDGQEFLDTIQPESTRNGAAMRSLPLGTLPDEREVLEKAHIQAQITHNTPEGIMSSQAIGLLAHFALNTSQPFSLAHDYLKQYLPESEGKKHLKQIHSLTKFNPDIIFGKNREHKGVPCDGVRTVGAVLYLLERYTSSKSILEEAILLGGDTDSVAGLSVGLSAVRYGLRDIPPQLHTQLYNGMYGKEYIIDLGNRFKNN